MRQIIQQAKLIGTAQIRTFGWEGKRTNGTKKRGEGGGIENVAMIFFLVIALFEFVYHLKVFLIN